jgi:hypothetical protein
LSGCKSWRYLQHACIEPSEQREIARSFATFSAEDEPDL